ncbi:MAG: bifunctional folylpolyglutamate synthase/dihydrofolate synthase [Chlamydiales bacterium]|nr:bifunctional folylpolyglutamate synthase/dihydrofolate synthase [Chlamydiales bacterium]
MNHIYERLFRMTSDAVKLNLEIPRLLTAFLNFPHQAYSTVHIAGTNGKGSVSTKIAKALQLSGLKVGLYTSPHLQDFRERITVQGEWISEEAITAGIEALFKYIDTNAIPATFFELTTALAFDYFRQQKVDVAVIETGLGGRLDATNVIDPLLTVITSISRDHAHILGDTLDEIAGEKAGILKPNVPLVLGSKAVFAPILKRAQDLGAPCRIAPEASGFYDAENSSTARTALEWLKELLPVTDEGINEGLRSRPPCRFERRGELIFDVAHNPDGFSRLFEAAQHFYPETKFYVLLGMSRDKEYERCLELASERAEKIFLVQAKGERSARVEVLGEALRKRGFTRFVEGENVSSTAELAAEEAKDAGAILLICGSFFIMQEAREALLNGTTAAQL